MNNNYEDAWMQTYSGEMFLPAKPEEAHYDINDIAHALSNECRFGGHCRQFYSVAQHCVICASAVPPEHKLQALMHDAPEAYYKDLPRGVKLQLASYKELEKRCWSAIAKQFNLPVELSAEVKEADNRALVTEKRDLLGSFPHLPTWGVDEVFKPYPDTIVPWKPAVAEEEFLVAFYHYDRRLH